MALDRQKILSELGSVVNQLQSANCGCLGNLFDNPPPSLPHAPYGHGRPPCGGHHHGCHGQHSCGGSFPNYQGCGRFMNNNFNQKSLSEPKAFFSNNSMQPVVKEVYDELKTITPQNTVANSPFAAQLLGLPYPPPNSQQGHTQNPTNTPQMYQNPNMMAAQNGVARSPPNTQQGQPQRYPNSNEMTAHNGLYSSHPNSMQGVPQNFTNNSQSNPQNFTNNSQHNPQNFTNNSQINPNSNMMAAQMGMSNPYYDTNTNLMSNINNLNNPETAQHAQGLAKFNELFPGVMGQGDLGFDPMKVALYMRTMANNKPNNNEASKAPPSQQLNAPPTPNPNIPPENPTPHSIPDSNPNNAPNNFYNNQDPSFGVNDPNTPMYQNDQQAYYALTNQPGIQKPNTNEYPNYGQYQPSEEAIPEKAVVNHNTYQSSESIVPTKLNPHEQNILGQPVQMLPVTAFRQPEPSLPQTLSPEPRRSHYSNVKGTISKTSLIPLSSRTSSKNSLQRLYNKYRSSQTYIPAKNQKASLSERQIRALTHDRQLERTGGDTRMNTEKLQNVEAVGHHGDIPANKGFNNSMEKPFSDAVVRNGLQDLVFTSYPLSTAWSFYGRRPPMGSAHDPKT